MDIERFSCPNPACTDYGKLGSGNIALYTRYGRKQVRLLICNTCGKTFSELKGTPFWDSRLDWDTIEKIYRTLLDGQGIRATARLARPVEEHRQTLSAPRRQGFSHGGTLPEESAES